MTPEKGRAVVLAEGCLGQELGKTANGLVLHSMRDEILAVIDSTHAGQDAGSVIAGREVGIPVVASFQEACDEYDPDTLYLGAAPVGGALPSWFEDTLNQAIEKGMTIYNGLHTFFSESEEHRNAAARTGATIIDVRKPPQELTVATGAARDLEVPRVLVMGTDCAVGKRITVVELVKEARRRGINAGFVATGQTGLMIGADAGAVIDRIPADFCAGTVESLVCEVAQRGCDIVFVYGQASVLHPAYSGVSLSILHGAAPNAVVMQHDPVRQDRVLFSHPAFKVAEIRKEIGLVEQLGGAKVVGIAINGRDCHDVDQEAQALSERTGLPAVDPIQRSASLLLDAVLEHLEYEGHWPPGRTQTVARAVTSRRADASRP